MTRKALFTALAALALAVGAGAQTSTWEIDTAHSSVGFSVQHMMVSNVRGYFTRFAGTLTGPSDDVTTAALKVTIETGSIDTREPKRDEHLRSADFFEVAKFPTMTFVSRKVEKVAPGKLRLVGDLTIRDVTKTVTLDVEGPTAQIKDPWGNTRVGARATGTINRKGFGLAWNKVLEAGGVLVSEDVDIVLEIELVKKAAAPAK
jgi:polyisoprenoid-binding protein YceI